MLDFKLKQGQVVFENGLLQYVDGAERIRQQLEFRLSIFRGEWFLDSEFGTPYFQSILGKRLTINGAISVIKTEIRAVEGINDISNFRWSLDRANRKLSVEFEAKTDFGIVSFP
ncbi:Phage protein [Paramixta manurensis]|uniref:Phage protein n=1 Tax=Paramixta manurensis TaxID=2740817 RepID=A0A6M8UCQ5_9GAMM|nr:Phage protein [Erwiniaceae bacterium PD-1]